MFELIAILLALLLFRLRKRTVALEQRVEEYRRRSGALEQRLAVLDSRLHRMELGDAPTIAAETQQLEASKEPADIHVPIERPLVLAEAPADKGPAVPERKLLFEPEPIESSKPPPAWRKAVAENWTGILGAAITVAGVAFFGAYASFKLGPQGRFALILAFATLLFAGSRFLRRFELWRMYGAWLQAIAGAAVLLACVGAQSLDRLKFIDDPGIGWTLLATGILLNLLCAYFTAHQAIASLHVLLSLIALAIPSQDLAAFVIATTVTAAGILLSYRSRWDVNLLVCLLAFAGFQQLWLERQLLGIASVRSYGVAGSLLIGASAALVHYRKKYASPSFERLPFIVHVLSWGTLGYNLLSYSRGWSWVTLCLVLSAAAATLLARIARKKDIRWLYATDTLVGQVLAMLAITRLGQAGLSALELAMLCHLELLAFNAVVNLEGERMLSRVGCAAQLAATLAVLFFAADAAGTSFAEPELPIAARLGLIALATFAYSRLAASKGFPVDDPRLVLGREMPRDAGFSLVTASIPALVLLGHVLTFNLPYSSAAAVAILAALSFFRVRNDSQAWRTSILLALIFLHAFHGALLVDSMGRGSLVWLRQFAPVAVLDLLLFFPALRFEYRHRLIAYLLAAHFALGAYALMNPRSDFAPGVAYLVFSLLALEGSRLLRRLRLRRADSSSVALSRPSLPDYVLQCGFAYLALFLYRHVLVHMQSEASIGPATVRLIVAGFALGTSAYWLLCAPSLASRSLSRANQLLAALLVEWSLALLALTIAVECAVVRQPLAWAVLAIALLLASARAGSPGRLSAYAWLVYLASAIQLGFVAGKWSTPRLEWHLRAAFVGPIAIAVQMFFVARAFRSRSWQRTIDWPAGMKWLGRLHSATLSRRPSVWLLYPLVLCVAVFLYWRFDRAVLTLLWVIEVFCVFSLGVILRQKHFVHVANVALIVCIGRLILYDLARTDVTVRAVVFIAVGLLMLAINAIYRRYGNRVGAWSS